MQSLVYQVMFIICARLYTRHPEESYIHCLLDVSLERLQLQGLQHIFESGVAKKCFESRSGKKYFLGPF